MGTIGIKAKNLGEADLSYALSQKYGRQDIMFEATQEIVKRAFGQYGFKRLQAWCIKENLASSSLMKILGMRNPRNPRYVSVR
jgi:RimJ/RimL family protein N-acetyltransferase